MTTTPSNEQSLDGLIERVKAATGPDDKLDYAVDEWLWRSGGKHHGEMDTLPPFTASIDAALALVERLLPGWVVADLCQNSRLAGDPWGCTLAIYYGSYPSKNRMAKSGYDFQRPSLAILAALLTALKDASE